jgi:CheY-like chemotaxis protein
VTPKRALIVDDSKSARVVLSRLLERHDLAVDMRDSAEAALHYLRDNRPDVIFMDHVMSGMDGLSAVQAIKNDPSTASIPIMMYTSQDGELYAGEARAIGAAGVLAKQMAPGDIAAVLMQLQVLPDKRDGGPRGAPLTSVPAGFDQVQPPAPEPGGGAIAGIVVTAAPAAAESTPAVAPPPSLTATDVRAIIEPLLQEQGIDLRRFVVASLDGVSGRVVTEVGERVQRAVTDLSATIVKATEPVPVPEPPPPPRPTGWIALAAVALVVAVGFGGLAWRQQGEIAVLKAVPPPPVAVSSAAVPSDVAPAPQGEAASASVPARANLPPSQRVPVAYGEAPFSPARIAALGSWLSGLERRGYAGIVRVTVAAGEYCLTGNPTEGYTPAPAELPANRCDVVGNPADDALRANVSEPPALAAVVAGVRERSHGTIDVRVAYANRSGSQGYPPATDANAGQWNAMAATRSYVEFAADTRPTS